MHVLQHMGKLDSISDVMTDVLSGVREAFHGEQNAWVNNSMKRRFCLGWGEPEVHKPLQPAQSAPLLLRQQQVHAPGTSLAPNLAAEGNAFAGGVGSAASGAASETLDTRKVRGMRSKSLQTPPCKIISSSTQAGSPPCLQ